MQKELEYLGYLLMDKGLKPQPKKVEAMKQIKPPKNPKPHKQFLGMINFYRDIWKKCSHILSPLSKLSNATKDKNISGVKNNRTLLKRRSSCWKEKQY